MVVLLSTELLLQSVNRRRTVDRFIVSVIENDDGLLSVLQLSNAGEKRPDESKERATFIRPAGGGALLLYELESMGRVLPRPSVGSCSLNVAEVLIYCFPNEKTVSMDGTKVDDGVEFPFPVGPVGLVPRGEVLPNKDLTLGVVEADEGPGWNGPAELPVIVVLVVGFHEGSLRRRNPRSHATIKAR